MNTEKTTTSILAEELAPLNARIEQIERQRKALEGQLRTVEKELHGFSADRQRFEALRDVCEAFDRLGELKADELFWKGIPGAENVTGHLQQVRQRVADFEGGISGFLEKQASLKSQIDRQTVELDFMYDEVHDAYDREQRRQEEFVVEREISAVPYRSMIMPWTKDAESEKRLRRAVLIALLASFLLGGLTALVKVPVPDRSVAVVEIPKRLAKLVKKQPLKPIQPPKPAPQPEKEEIKTAQDMTKPKPEPPKTEPPKPKEPPKKPGGSPAPKQVAKAGGGKAAARKKAERVGVLAFKNSFKDLMKETPVAKLGTDARITKKSPRIAGQAVAQRSLVAIQATGGSSGGISNAAVSRNIGNGNIDRLGGSGIGKGGGSGNGVGLGAVDSAIADIAESGRPLSDGPGAGRTDEEIQIIFDRYKATLYRIYNRELRKDPTLRGKILLRIIIETSGAVSLCEVESTDLGSLDLVAMIVERIKRFNFGAKEGVPALTILYPIDFLPAG